MNEYNYKELEEKLIKHLGLVFLKFQEKSDIPEEYYGLDNRLAVTAITNAVSSIRRSANYHSTTGPSNFKIAGFCGCWIARNRPIWRDFRKFTNSHRVDLSIELEQINSDFAMFLVQSLVNKGFGSKFAHDLSYCFEFRSLSGDDVAMLLEHALK